MSLINTYQVYIQILRGPMLVSGTYEIRASNHYEAISSIVNKIQSDEKLISVTVALLSEGINNEPD